MNAHPQLTELRSREIARLLYESRSFDELFDVFENDRYLAAQAAHVDGFRQSAADVESFVLPAARQRRDWPRFLRHATVALNLRRTADSLAHAAILAALARAGQVARAEDAAARVADPLARAAARAVVAAALPHDHVRRATLVNDGLVADVRAARSPAPDAPERLATIARCLPELAALVPQWVTRLCPAPEGAARVWQGLVEGWLARGESWPDELWDALARTGEDAALHIVAERLAVAPERLDEAVQRTRALLSADVAAVAIARLLGRHALRAPEPARRLWIALCGDAPWTAAQIEAGAGVLALFARDELEAAAGRLDDALARATLRVVALEASATRSVSATSELPALADASWQALHALTDGPARLNLVLRHLRAAEAATLADENARRVGLVGDHLAALRHAVAPPDLALFLDLVARHRPRDVRVEVESIVWAPDTTGETLRTLTEALIEPAVLAKLLERAERYAAAVSATEGEGFRLRRDLLRRLVVRLCLQQRSLVPLDRSADRLLPDEEDDARVELAAAWHAQAAGEAADEARALALQAASRIRDRRRCLLSRLPRLEGDALRRELRPRRLYAALGDVRPLGDELRALVPLLRPPYDPPEVVERPLAALRDDALRLHAHLRLARHRVAFERDANPGLEDLSAAIERLRPHLVIESDEALARLTPEIAVVGAVAGGAQARTEFEEALRQLVEMKTVAPELQVEALQDLLARVGKAFGLEPAGDDAGAPARGLRGWRERRQRRHARGVLEAFLRCDFEPAALLPAVVAAAERFGLRDAAFEAALDSALTRWRDAGSAKERAHDPTAPARAGTAALCRMQSHERSSLAPGLARAGVEPVELRAIAWLTCARAPQAAAQALGLLPPPECDVLAARLIVQGWATREAARLLAAQVKSDAARRRVALALDAPGAGADAHAWIETIAQLTAAGEIDPVAPGCDEILAPLWSSAAPEGVDALGRAVQTALAHGTERAEQALRVWLHALLAPCVGGWRPGSARRVRELRAALRAARHLGPPPRRQQETARPHAHAVTTP
jgi:hypothetical protein